MEVQRAMDEGQRQTRLQRASSAETEVAHADQAENPFKLIGAGTACYAYVCIHGTKGRGQHTLERIHPDPSRGCRESGFEGRCMHTAHRLQTSIHACATLRPGELG